MKSHRGIRTLHSPRWAVVLLALSYVTATSMCAFATEKVRVLYQSIGFGAGSTYRQPLGIFFDTTRGECYIADTGNHRIVVCDENGIPLTRFHRDVTIDGRKIPGEPRSIVVDDGGRIFVTDAAAEYIDVLDPLGRPVDRVDPPQIGDGPRGRFGCLALGPGKTLYATVAGERTTHVAVIDEALEVSRVMTLDTPASDRVCVTGMAVDDIGRIYITDPCGTQMVQIYDTDGRYVVGFGVHDTGFENFSFPAGIALMSNGDMWVVDSIRQTAARFSPEGEFVTFVGGKGDGPGGFNYPSALATDGKKKLFVLEKEGNRYQCFQFDEDE